MDDSLLLNESVLSRDILLNSILPHLDLHALINFSSASRSCHRLVFRETPPSRWRTIQFQRRPPRSRRRHGSKISENAEYNICNITDDQLTSFLTNINARETTQHISLMGCPRLRGRGLTPLDGSNVLESIDLRVAGPKRQGNVDVNAVVSLLRRMLPSLPVEEEGMLRLFAPLSWIGGGGVGSSRSSSANGISSSSSLWERPIGEVKKYYTPFSLQRVVFPPGCETLGIVRYFHQCHQFWNCVRDRFDAVGKSCSKCHAFFHNDIPAWRCRVCGEYSCYPTKHHNHLDDDDDDDDDDENPPMEPCRSPTHCRRCHSCHDTFCSKEDEHHDACFACPVCQTWFCESCALPPVCSECPVRKCIWCSNIVKCAACGKESCANHGFEGCDCCDRVFCEDCRQNELGVCVVCNRLYCSVSCHDGAH